MMGGSLHVLKMSDFEQRLLVASLNDFRNHLLEERRPTEDINSLLIKVIDAPTKREARRDDRGER